MAGMLAILLSVVVFTMIMMTLVAVILIAKARLVPGGDARVLINEDPERTITVPIGGKLMYALADKRIYVSSACGGGGTCGQCRVRFLEGGGPVLPTERSKLTRRQLHNNYRLSCQVPVKEDMSIAVPVEALSVRKWECTVRSNVNVATFIKEVVLELPAGESVDFRAGGYIQIEAPPHRISFKDFRIEEEYRPAWDRLGLWDLVSIVDEPVARAYSMANYPEEKGVIILNVRIALPPPAKPNAPPGKMSSYVFSLKPGDTVTIAGPYGEFFARDSDNEMVVIGGGAGLAPLRSIIFDQLKRVKASRKISFWYGARNLRETFYRDDFDALGRQCSNFEWQLCLSRPLSSDAWSGPVAYVHKHLYDSYLKDHPAPEDCEYYLCGPPMMIASVLKTLDDLGVERDNIFFDDFGG